MSRLCMSLAVLLLSVEVGAVTLSVGPGGAETKAGTRFTSIAAALAKLQAGDTLLIEDGVYREAIDLRAIRLPADARRTVIAAARDAHPLIKGSDVVKDWQRIGDDLYVRRAWSVNSQQVFLNGKPLKQIGGEIFGGYPSNPRHAFAALHASQGGIWPGRSGKSRGDMVAESFFYDAAEKALYVKTATRLTDRDTVEVSVRPHLAIGMAVNNVELRGLRFEHANTTDTSQAGALSFVGNRLLFSHISVANTDGACFDITGDANVIEHSTANYCGSVGMKVRGRDARLIGNETSFNNTRGFNKWWEAGGAKFVGDGGLRHSEVTAHRAYANNGDGLWFDWRNDGNRIHRNIVAYNTGMGIHYEASTGAEIRDNYVVGNAQRGIYLPNSSRSIIENNLVAANKMEAIAIVDERRAAEKGPEDFIPRGNRVAGNVIAWNGKASLVLPAPLADNRSDDNVFVGNAPTLSIGWSPLVHGLDAWRVQAHQDGNSVWRWLSLPPELERKLAAKESFSPQAATQWRDAMRSLGIESGALDKVTVALERLAILEGSP